MSSSYYTRRINTLFEELDYQTTDIGDLSLRRRTDPRLNDELIYEVKLGEEFLMSSLVTAGEIALADLTLLEHSGDSLDIVVGGLGLGFTAAAALKHNKVRSMLIVDALSTVIGWHEHRLVPLGATLSEDDRCQFKCADFFSLAVSELGFQTALPRQYDAILLDIDHSPVHRLTTHNEDFYSANNLTRMRKHIKPNGIFSMWSNDPPDEHFVAILKEVFLTARAEVCEFPNPYSGATSRNTIYLASR